MISVEEVSGRITESALSRQGDGAVFDNRYRELGTIIGV